MESRLVSASNWLNHYLKECDANHPGCAGIANERMTMPGRLLDLETEFNNPTIRLVKPDAGFTTPYMTLSHRWGNVHPCKTITTNLSERFCEIKMKELPKTFQHAVIITRRLGIRFLWIDSLCIVQDDPYDWEIEASKMASIYSGSYLTIMAVSSVDSRGGCIPEYPPSAYFKIDARGATHKSIYVRQDQNDVDRRQAHLEITGGSVPWAIPLVNIPSSITYREHLLIYTNSCLEVGSIKNVYCRCESLFSTRMKYSGNVNPS